MDKIGIALKQFLLVLASQVPALGIALVWWQRQFQRPVLAAGTFLAYETGVFLWRQIGKPAWDEVWEKELRPPLVKGLAEWLNVTARNLASGFGRRYLQQVQYDHRVFPVRGLLTPGQGALEVEQVFVELRIAPSHAQQVSANPLTVKALSGSQPIWTFLRRLRKKDAIALAVLGPPGCGKTTLLKHLALIFAARRQRRYRVRAAIPLLLFLREHVAAIVEARRSLAEVAQGHFSDPQRYPELKPPPYWFARHLKAGGCVVLLDGLDEVEAAHRSAVAAWVEDQIRAYPRCRFLLSARPQGYRDNPLAQAYVLEVLSFTDSQVQQFVTNWYLAKKLLDYGKDDRGVRQDAQREAGDLLRRLDERPHLKALTVNPLLLTMIANVHNYRGALPERRIELYAEICDVLLGHWQRGKGLSERLTAAQKREALQPLAEEMMLQQARVIATADALEIITPPLRQMGIAEAEIPLFLKELHDISGLFLEQDPGQWGFAHLTFQEYLCAVHWHATGKAFPWKAEEWQALVEQTWWHETLRLYAAQRDATELVRACTRIGTDEALKLAGSLANEALKLDNTLRETLQSSLQRVIIRLRREPKTVSAEEFLQEFQLDEHQRPLSYIQNEYEDRGETVFDRATGLTWQKAGSSKALVYADAQKYIVELNRKKFAGYDDWRLPTIPELMSLLEPEKQSNGFYLSPIFDVPKVQYYWEWSADKRSKKGEGSAESAWYVGFLNGSVDWLYLNNVDYVRGVRS